MNNKKTWVEPGVENVCISETEYGGEPSTVYDQLYYDKDGALHVNFPDSIDSFS